MHGLASMAIRKWTPNQEWLILGIVLGNLFPDTDNLAVAYATVAALPTHGLHRTFTHSMFTIAALVVALWILAVLARPYAPWKVALLVAMAGTAALAVALPPVRHFFELDVPVTMLPQALAIGAVGAVGVEAVFRRAAVRRQPDHR